MPQARVIVVMGVSGSGKTTIGRPLADRLGWEFAEGDAFHPEQNVAKMSSGHPLTDGDRWPWLQHIADWIDANLASGRSGVVTCSALKRRYRDVLRSGHDDAVVFLHLRGTEQQIGDRLQARRGHFMPPGLLSSQLADLEPLGRDENGVVIEVSGPVEQTVQSALAALETPAQ